MILDRQRVQDSGFIQTAVGNVVVPADHEKLWSDSGLAQEERLRDGERATDGSF